jgi:hypothetical protein
MTAGLGYLALALGLATLLFLLNWFHVWWIKKMLRDFVRMYPGECPVCKFHRAGIADGTLAKDVADNERLPKPGDAA